jgi:predicted RNase H-like HicB family nuclease
MQPVPVDFEQDSKSGFWTATSNRYPEIVTQGKTLDETRRRVLDALSLILSPIELEAVQLVDGEILAATASPLS